MTSPAEDPTPTDHPEPFEPQGHLGVVPYDFRRPSWTRVKTRAWNPSERRFFPPHSIGIGWTINFYWLFHLAGYFKNRSHRHAA
jgi:hypothetical protein